MGFWDNLSEHTAVYIRKGGAGNNITLLDELGAMIDAPTGGAADVESRFGLNAKGQRTYLGALKQGDDARITTTASIRVDLARFLNQLRLGRCPFDLYVYSRCGDISPLNYSGGYILYDGYTTNKSFDNPLSQLADNTGQDLMRQLDLSFAPIEDAALHLVHLDITGTVSDFDINKVISVGVAKCSGDCGIVGENDGEQDFWAVTDADTTPGHGGFGAPRFLYTEDGGNTWNGSSVTVLLGANLLGVAKAGDYAIVVGTTGIAYAKFQDIKDGVLLPWSLALSASNINDVVSVSSDVLYACANGGIIYKSADGGFTWSVLSNAAQTSQNLNSVSFVDSTTGYFAGNSGALVQYFNGTLSLMTVRTSVGGAAITANFNVVATAPFRGQEIYLGTSTGLMYRCTNAVSSYPLFSLMSGLPLSGSGSIDDLVFSGFRGSVLWILQSNAQGYTRVLRDITGGHTDSAKGTGMKCEIIGDFTNPSNFGINSIASPSITRFITVGQVHQTYGFIGSGVPA
jgi:hypothetical protein